MVQYWTHFLQSICCAGSKSFRVEIFSRILLWKIIISLVLPDNYHLQITCAMVLHPEYAW